MSILFSLLTQILHVCLILIAAPTVAGAFDWLRARLGGRAGPPVGSPWLDLVRLSRKTPMMMESVSIGARLAPALALGATLSAAALVPSFTLGMALAPIADLLVIVSLLALARAAGSLAALDCGTAPSGLAAQNASALSVLAEPALMVSVVAVALIGGSFNLDVIIGQQREGLLLPAAAQAVTLTAMLALVLAEANAADDRLEQMLGGRELAMSRLTAWLRRLVWIDLIGSLFLPIGMAATDAGPLAWLIGLSCWAVKILAFLLCLSAVQTMLGRISPHSLPDLVGVAALLALLAAIMVLASTGLA